MSRPQPGSGHRAGCRKSMHAFYYSGGHQRGAGLGWLGAESVSAELMEGQREGEEVHLNKWIALREAGAESWTGVTRADGENKIKRGH